MSFSIDIKGLRELQANITKLPQQLKVEASAIVENGAKEWVRLSKQDAPVDFGVLRNEITYAKLNDLSFEIISGASYSPYVEWGTIEHVSVPAELQPYAILFKGKGIRKTGGIYPHPYFFKQARLVLAKVEQGISSILKEVKL
jgi:HK97 gp10 family phage protein